MSAIPSHRYTVEQYLSFERGSDSKHEFFQGEIFAMVGGSQRHAVIIANCVAALVSQLRSRPCNVYSSDMRLKVSPTGLYTYPDVMVACGDAAMTGAGDMLESPTALIEVLSPSTEEYDRGTKFEHYRQIKSLRDYLLVRQDAYHVEHRRRLASGKWVCRDNKKQTDVVKLKSIDCELLLSDIYRRVTLDG
jgi:Uma2 family endonuclease